MFERRHSRLVALLVFSTATVATPAASQQFDLAGATCAEFVQMNPNDRAQLSLWLAGFFAGAAQQPVIDVERLTSIPADLGALCEKSPALRLVGAETRAIFSAKPAQ